MTRTRGKKPLFEPGCVPAPGAPPGEPVHKVCAENWIAANPTEARLGRFASDVQPKRRRNDDHA
ncbi:hypothetical protein [Streptomyces coeruleorubidus]|uniref:hypothetical protein n=1 Tax=Streptomyces coeruleorubidus TaxID=116188 RepID=UPI00379BA5DC